MKIAIASGKGGTGKTTIAVNLAYVAARSGMSTCYMDCDVEEPNGAIFLKPTFDEEQTVYVDTPKVDREKCTACGLCGKICQFSAIAAVKDRVLTFPQLCHGCGGCKQVCPAGAITDEKLDIGQLQSGKSGDIHTIQAMLKIGRAMSPPLIRAIKNITPTADITISDCPPGTACPAVESLRGNDFALLVTEPTPFGLNDLKLAVETVKDMKIPFAIVINRSDENDGPTIEYCQSQQAKVLAAIPDIRQVAEAYSRGVMASSVSDAYRSGFEQLLAKLIEEVQQCDS